ncbi:MAG: hypothetical protein AAGA85_27310 [Bacteroidota bacterium]
MKKKETIQDPMRRSSLAVPIPFLLILMINAMISSCTQEKIVTFSIESQPTETDALIVSIAIIDEQTLWLSGTNSTFMRSISGGDAWETFRHPEVDTFQYRDIHAVSAEEVVLLAIGDGVNSQIHKFSVTGGWETAFVMGEEEGFLNSIAFWDEMRGLAFGDSFDGKPYLLETKDGGNSWSRIEGARLPDAGEGEGGFASSGSCIDVGRHGVAWVGTGASGHARILRTDDYGESWKAYESPIIKGELAGITSVHFRTNREGFIAGGDLSSTEAYTDNMALTTNSGKDWHLIGRPETPGPFYGSDLIRYGGKNILVATGPRGADISLNGGESWANITDEDLWVVDLDARGFGWLGGRDGQLYKIEFHQRQ